MANVAAHRLFFALVPSFEARRQLAALAADLQQQSQLRARWLAPARYHLTLQFLGSFERIEAEPRAVALAAGAALRFSPFELRLDHLFSFPRRHQPPWVLGLGNPPPALFALREQLRDALRAAHWPAALDQRFHPHLSLAYGHRALDAPLPITAIAWPVDRVLLYQSSSGQVEFLRLGEWRATVT